MARIRQASSRALYPVALDVAGLPVLVVGGGAVAERKVKALRQARACVTVVAPDISPALAKSGARRKTGLRILRRKFKPSDLAGQQLVFAATDNLALNAGIAAAAKKRGVWINVAAPPEAGNMVIPATLRRGPLAVSISTGGASAALARTVRLYVSALLGPEWGRFAALLEARRSRVLRAVADPKRRRELLRKLAARDWAGVIRKEGVTAAARRMDALIAKAASSTC